MGYYLGIDQSKRSTGCVLLTETGELASFRLICNCSDDNEELIISQWYAFQGWLDDNITSHEDIAGALIEGLAFGAVGSGKDFLAGLQWWFRGHMRDDYGVFLGTTPVSQWRSQVLSRQEQQAARAEGKEGLKWATFYKLPAKVQRAFAAYVNAHSDEINRAKDPKTKPGSKSRKYQEALWDLADAYFIAQYRLQLSNYR